MNISSVAVSSGPSLAIIAALVGLAFLLLGRRNAPTAVVVALTALMAASLGYAGVRTVDLEPTHALLDDTETTNPQSVVAPSDDTGDITVTEEGEQPTTESDGTAAGNASDGNDSAGPGHPQGDPPTDPPAEGSAPPPAQPDGPAAPERPGTDAGTTGDAG